jgi:hypothetical protein
MPSCQCQCAMARANRQMMAPGASTVCLWSRDPRAGGPHGRDPAGPTLNGQRSWLLSDSEQDSHRTRTDISLATQPVRVRDQMGHWHPDSPGQSTAAAALHHDPSHWHDRLNKFLNGCRELPVAALASKWRSRHGAPPFGWFHDKLSSLLVNPVKLPPSP